MVSIPKTTTSSQDLPTQTVLRSFPLLCLVVAERNDTQTLMVNLIPVGISTPLSGNDWQFLETTLKGS